VFIEGENTLARRRVKKGRKKKRSASLSPKTKKKREGKTSRTFVRVVRSRWRESESLHERGKEVASAAVAASCCKKKKKGADVAGPTDRAGGTKKAD